MNFSPKIFLIGFSFLLISATHFNSDQINTNHTQDTNMLIHNVYFYLNDDVTPEQKNQFEEGLKTLVQISEIHKSEIGIPAQTKDRDVTDHGFAYYISTSFATMEDYEVYAEHPDHMEFIDTYNSLWADVKVFDSEIISEQ